MIYLLPLVSMSYLMNAQTDAKVRFGLRVTPQPTWYSSGDKNNSPSGAKLGFGFGLNMEYRFSDVISLLTGVGGDFESGKYQFRHDANYNAMYFLDQANLMVAPKSGNAMTIVQNPENTGYELKERTLKTTFVTIPLILKLSTKEFNGLKYFGQFGAELGIRIKAQATDSYYAAYSYDAATGTVVATVPNPPSLSQIDVSKDANVIPVRVGLNVGGGAEYRLAGSTAVFASVNFFRSFINVYRQESRYVVYQAVPNTSSTTTTVNYKFIQQNLMLNAVRINIGIMF